MEFEVSPGFTPHQRSAVRENQQVRVIRSWEAPVPPVTLPLQPGNPPCLWEEGPPSLPHLSLSGWLSQVLQRGAGRGLRSLWWSRGTGTAGTTTPISATRARDPSSCSGPFCPGPFPIPSRNSANPIRSHTCHGTSGGRAAAGPARGVICLTSQSNDVLRGAEGMSDSIHKVFCHAVQRIFLCCPSTTTII